MEYEKFNKQILTLYKELNLDPDNSKFKHMSSLGDTIAQMSYVFPPGSGKYKNRITKISPSYYPFVISYIGFGGMVDDILMRQLNPSPSLRVATHNASFKYLIITMKMKVDIGLPSIMIYPNTIGSRIASNFCVRKIVKTNSKSFNKKFALSIKNKQKWFLDCIDDNIIDSLIKIDFPKLSGAIFQFSKNHSTFAIVPRTLGKDMLIKVIQVLNRFCNNIEKIYKK